MPEFDTSAHTLYDIPRWVHVAPSKRNAERFLLINPELSKDAGQEVRERWRAYKASSVKRHTSTGFLVVSIAMAAVVCVAMMLPVYVGLKAFLAALGLVLWVALWNGRPLVQASLDLNGIDAGESGPLFLAISNDLYFRLSQSARVRPAVVVQVHAAAWKVTYLKAQYDSSLELRQVFGPDAVTPEGFAVVQQLQVLHDMVAGGWVELNSLMESAGGSKVIKANSMADLHRELNETLAKQGQEEIELPAMAVADDVESVESE